MAITLAASGSNTGSSSSEVSGLTVTAGQLITVVAPIAYASNQTPAAGDLTKTAGSATIGAPTLDKVISFNSGNAPYYLALAFYSVLVTGSGSLSVTVTPNGGSAVMANHLSVWNGTWDSSRVESAPTIASSATDNQQSFPSASATSAGAALFFAGLSVLQTVNNTLTPDASFTLLTKRENGTTQMCGGAAYQLVGSGTTDDSTWTATAASNFGWASGLVVYREVVDPDVDVTIDTAGAMTVAGQTVTVTLSGDIGVTIDTPGAVAWAGQDITASTAENIDVAIDTAGAMTVAGQAGVDVTISVDVTNGEMSMAGQDMAVDIDSDIGVAIDTAGAIGWAGQTVATALSGDIDVAIDTAGAMAVAGQNLTVTFDGDVLVSIDTAGAMSWAGQDIGVALSGDINVSLDAGSVLLAGQTLTAVITIAVPDVVGDSQAAGTATLEGEGFVVSISMSYSNTVPAGDIKSQSPAGGVQAAVGSTVVITVSRGVAPVALIYKNGTLFDADGRMATVFLGDAEAVPADAHFIQGLAHSSIGERYVAALPASGIVQAIGGVAVRADGAMVVALDGAVIGAIEGVGVSTAGEAVVTESNPTHFVGGLGVDDVGRLSVTSGS